MKRSLLFIFSLILSASAVLAQTVKGIVKGGNGTTIPGATITVRGTKIATVTDTNGAFTIDAKQQPPFYIRVSYVGYKPQDFQVLQLQETPIELILVEDTQLDEIVV
ncbi:MAG: TonB-dependent receptor, partial [Sphingobacteriales bacterium]